MKRVFTHLLIVLLLPFGFSCSTLRNYTLNEGDAAAALKQMLEFGARESVQGQFSRDAIMTTLFPEPVRKALNTLGQLGVTGEVDRFTTTLGTAAERTAEQSIPIFVSGINRMSFTDAIRIVKNGGTSATDYLRSSIGTELRNSIRPVMLQAIQEYKLDEQWNKVNNTLQTVTKNKVNIDLATLMAGLVSERMFQEMEEKERQVRTEASARTTPLLQRVFSRNWN